MTKLVATATTLFLGTIIIGSTSTTTSATSNGGGTLRGRRRRRVQATTLPAIQAVDDRYETIQNERLDVGPPGILENDNNNFPTFVASHSEADDFQGTLRVYSDGRIRYDPPIAGNFEGEERFTYQTCQLTSGGEPTPNCASANVYIQVKRDPDRPSNPPKANDDEYTVVEGTTLEITEFGAGFLGNDDHESDKSTIYRSQQRGTSSMKGTISTRSNGRFTYVAPERCTWTGEDVFYYHAAYEAFPDMESNEARVTIRVKQDSHRPEKPQPDDDLYQLHEGETLEVQASSNTGLLWNDIGGELLYVRDVREHDGFEGDLKVNPDGSFRYESESGKTGTFRADYEVCQAGWEDCVDCATGTLHLRVDSNPDKPSSPPKPGTPMDFSVAQGQKLELPAPGILIHAEYDQRYTLVVESYDYEGQADMKIRTDGSFRYQSYNDFVGTDPFTYRACYLEWPDLCSTGSGSFTVQGSDSSSRRGVATVYFIQYEGAPSNGNCEEVEPTLTMSCEGEGELALVNIGTNDNSNCLIVNGVGRCVPSNKGHVYVECRDGRANNSLNRKLHVSLQSERVNCQGSSATSTTTTTFHAGLITTWCNNNNWVNQPMTCSGGQLVGSQPQYCYGTSPPVGSNGGVSQPPPINMTTTNYEQCLYV